LRNIEVETGTFCVTDKHAAAERGFERLLVFGELLFSSPSPFQALSFREDLFGLIEVFFFFLSLSPLCFKLFLSRGPFWVD
jgi:hypothetical protein